MKCPLCSAAEKIKWCEIAQPFLAYWSCQVCKLIWLDEEFRLGKREEEARYQTHQNHVSDPSYMAYLSRTALPVVAHLAPGAHGLDYGCGPTEGMKTLLSPMGFSVESYDPFFFPHGLLNFRYEFLICCEAAEHFFEPAQEFERISNLVEKGGWLAVRSQLAVSREDFPQWWYRRDPTHVVFYTTETVRWIAQRWGWEIVLLEDPLWVLKKT